MSSTNSLPETWDELKLDVRLLEAITALNWQKPTLVQSACIPLVLQGNDMSVQASTGTGKTAAFLCPIIQHVIREREITKNYSFPFALIIVPSVELARQTVEVANELSKFIKPRITFDDISSKNCSECVFMNSEIIVSTAALISKSIKSNLITKETLGRLRILVLDEVDWLMDVATSAMNTIQCSISQLNLQILIFTATLSDSVASFKMKMLNNPTNISYIENETANNKRDDTIVDSRISIKCTQNSLLKQFYLIAQEECHEHTLLFSLFRLNLISGKTLIFMNDEKDIYNLHSFLEQLGIATSVYDSSLPLNSRLNSLKNFQCGIVNTLICTDNTIECASEDLNKDEVISKVHKNKRTESKNIQLLPALNRGIDFANVSNVIMFDGIEKPNAINFNKYLHRIGRTARAGNSGTSILILRLTQAQKVLNPLKNHLLSQHNMQLKPFKKMHRNEAAKLQYRVDTILANVTRTSTKRLRVATAAAELAKSNYLSTHMNENDKEILKNIVKNGKKYVKSDVTVLDLPLYMKIHADDADSFIKRMNSRKNCKKEEILKNAIKEKKSDPLKAVLLKVNREVAAIKRKRN